MNRSLNGRVVIVTGASHGIGAATAVLLAARGASVVVNYLSDDCAAAKVVRQIESAGGQAVAVQADVREPAQIDQLLQVAVERYHGVDVLVSNANIRHRLAPFLEMKWEHFEQKLIGELQAAFHLTKAVVPLMRARGSGRLIFVGSEHSEGPATGPGMIANGSAKAALVTFVRYLAHELGSMGITANLVSPSMVLTERSRAFLPPELVERASKSIPLGRAGEPDDIAGVIAFLASDDSRFVTGVRLPVTGGGGLARMGGPPLSWRWPGPSEEPSQ